MHTTFCHACKLHQHTMVCAPRQLQLAWAHHGLYSKTPASWMLALLPKASCTVSWVIATFARVRQHECLSCVGARWCVCTACLSEAAEVPSFIQAFHPVKSVKHRLAITTVPLLPSRQQATPEAFCGKADCTNVLKAKSCLQTVGCSRCTPLPSR